MFKATTAASRRSLTTAALLVALVCPRPALAGDKRNGDPDRSARSAKPAKIDKRVRALGDAYRAFTAGEYRKAFQIARRIDTKRLENTDYAVYVRSQSAYLLGRHKTALKGFSYLSQAGSSRFRDVAAWRVADCRWQLGDTRAAEKRYRALIARYEDSKKVPGDLALARFRIAESLARRAQKKQAVASFRTVLLKHPAHPLASTAEARLRELGGSRAIRLSADDRLARARVLTSAHLWHESVAELALIGDDHDARTLRDRDFWTATTLFKMRRRYKDAADIFLRLYKDMGSRAGYALFHGARALSRADFDAEAITWYQRVVAEYPRSDWAPQAQYLSGWLHFNLGDYQAALPNLRKMLTRFSKSRWAVDARWFLGFSLYRLGQFEAARPHFRILSRRKGRLAGGKGAYWHARALERLGKSQDASSEYQALVTRFPFSWYAHLARARLTAMGVSISPFGDPTGAAARDPEVARQLAEARMARAAKVPALAAEIGAKARARLVADPLIRRADELLAAGLDVEAGYELRRGEKGFLKRAKNRAEALALLMERYHRAGNFNRPWMLAIVHGGRRALNAEPEGTARMWWRHGYPQAYRTLIESAQGLGENPDYYLYSIMRKESGFNPHVLSFADAIGLLQMIPATTRRVAAELGMTYTDDLLYDPKLNIQTASWYIGRLLKKFRGQIPLGSGSFNCGPRPVMRWLDKFGDLPMDEFVETVPYRGTREYMKKVTETYSRYVYLYADVDYRQPLVVERDYVKDNLTY